MIARLIAVAVWCAWQGTAPVGDGAADPPDRGYFGLMVQPLDDAAIDLMRSKPVSAQRGAAMKPGLLVAGLFQGGPAEIAGLAVDDVITSVAGTSTESGLRELQRAMRNTKAGEKVAVEYLRVDGQGQSRRMTVDVVPIARAAMMKLKPPPATTRPAIGRDERPKMVTDFETAGPDGAMQGWKFARFGPGAAAEWRVVEKAGASSGKGVLTIIKPGGDGTGWDLCLSESPLFSGDYFARARINAESGRGAEGGGIVFGYQDARNFYAIMLDFKKKEAVLYKVSEGRATVLNKRDSNEAARVGVSIESGKWHLLQAERQTTRLVIRMDGSAVLDARDTTFTGGLVGVLTPSGAVTMFDDFRAEEPPKRAR